MSKKKKNKKDRRHGTQPLESKPIEIADPYLCVRGPIYGPSGYTRMTLGVIKGMHQAGKKFWIDPLAWAVQPTIEATQEFKDIFKAHVPVQEDANRTTGLLCICLPADLPSQQMSSNVFNMTIFETTRIPDEWIQVLRSSEHPGTKTPAIKGLILPSKGNLESFREAPQEKTIVPIAIDYETFTYDGPAADLPQRSDFNILLSYHQGARKNPEFVIKLINELDQNVTVYIKTFGLGMSTWERAQIVDHLKSTIKSDCSVVLLYDLVSDEEQAKMYRAMDLFVNVAHGEGWDLPRCEAYSCGVPAIGSLFIGPDDYTIPEFRLIDHNLVPCPEIPPFFSSAAKWAELDLVEYLRAIEIIRSDRKKYREYALVQREWLMLHTGTVADMAEKIWKAVMG